jgi:hypothetical protein
MSIANNNVKSCLRCIRLEIASPFPGKWRRRIPDKYVLFRALIDVREKLQHECRPVSVRDVEADLFIHGAEHDKTSAMIAVTANRL